MTDLESIKAYIDTTKTFFQLSSGGLVLPLVLKAQVLNLFRTDGTCGLKALTLICASWVSFLLAIGAGARYQYAVVKFVEQRSVPLIFVGPEGRQRLAHGVSRGAGAASVDRPAPAGAAELQTPRRKPLPPRGWDF